VTWRIRRVHSREATVAEKWKTQTKRYFAEFFVIVLAVWLSFLAENLRENRRERTSERASLELLLADLTEGDFAVQVDRSDRSLRAIEQIRQARDGNPPPRDSLGAWLTEAAACSHPVVNKAEYESLKSSGGLNLISDPEVRHALATHYERYEPVLELAAQDCDFSFMRPLAREIRVEPQWMFPKYEVTGNIDAIMANQEFFMELGHARQRKGLLSVRYEIMTAQRDTLLAQLQTLLDRW
jgi:hypothetical protein